MAQINDLARNYNTKNLDISGFSKDNSLTITFTRHEEAIDFRNHLDPKYVTDLQLVRELYEIPENDEHFYANRNNELSDYCEKSNSLNRYSPGDPRLDNSGRYVQNGIFTTITSSMDSNNEPFIHGRKRLSNQNEVRTHHPAYTGFERISYGSGIEL